MGDKAGVKPCRKAHVIEKHRYHFDISSSSPKGFPCVTVTDTLSSFIIPKFDNLLALGF